MAKRAKSGPRPTPSTPPSSTASTTSPASESKRSSVVAAKERREERERERRRTQQMYVIGGIVVAAVLIALLFFAANQPAEAPIPPDAISRYAGLEKGRDDEGYPRLGSSKARVQVVEFSSFGCPGCAQFHRDVFPSLLERVKAGDVSFTYIPLLTGEGNVTGAAQVALCADKQDKFWETHDTLFNWHDLYLNNAFSQNRLTSGVRALQLDEGQINSCVKSESINNLITKAQGKGVLTTPTIRVNNSPIADNTLDTLNKAIDAALANAPKPRATAVKTQEATQEATAAATSEPTVKATTAKATAMMTQEATVQATKTK